MIGEPTVDAVGDPAEARVALNAAAALGPTALDPSTGAVLVFRYADIDRIAHDRRAEGVGMTWFDIMGIQGDLRRWYGSLMFTNEGAPHSRLRRLVSRAFTPRSVEQLRYHTGALVESAFAGLEAAGGGDLVAALGRLPIRVMCRLLGVPEEDVVVFGDWADALSPVFGFMDAAQIRAAESALCELQAYVSQLVERRAGDPGDDLLTALLGAEDNGDRLGRDEVVTMVANLLVAGHDTTSSQIGCSLMTLLRHPEVAGRVRRGEVNVADVVTETIRYEPSIGVIPRTLTEPIEVGGSERPAGTLLLLAVMTGNRDPSVWEDPDSFRADRFASPSCPRLLSFGSGPHYCLGANLARMTLEETVRGFARDEVSLTGDPEEVGWRLVLGRSPARLPVGIAHRRS